MKLGIQINNCHGINTLSEEIDFGDKPVIIHAPNGTFKTSFYNTLKEWIDGDDSYDLVTGVVGTRVIKVDGHVANPDEFEVFSDFSHDEPLNNSKGILLNPSLKSTYDSALVKYENERNAFLNRLSKDYKINKIDSVLCRVFKSTNLDDALKKIHIKLSKRKRIKSFPYNYSDYFSDTIGKNITKPINRAVIDKYQKIYNKTLKETFIKEGVFDLYNLINVSTSLADNNYFVAGNQILLKGKKPITSSKDLDILINSIKNKVTTDPELQSAFVNLEIDFSKKGMNKVAENIKNDPSLAKQYKNYDFFEESYLLDKFNSSKKHLNDVLNQYKKSKSIIRKIKGKARKDDELWKEVVDTFNNRFRMPFVITIPDTPSAVLGVEDVVYKYQYIVNGHVYDIDEDTLVNDVLSEGETRVFSLLNTIFKIKELEKAGAHKVLIFDDVADAFDYSNKHAIIEYLYEISAKTYFDVLVLTHNFDFYRHFGNRISGRNSSKFASSDGKGNITFSEGGYLNNLYTNYLRVNAQNGDGINHAIAIVPFARAVEEIINPDFLNNSKVYNFLTGILHYRSNSGAKLTGNSYAIRIKQLLTINCVSLLGNKDRLYKIIYNQASLIASSTSIDQKIEEKIVLSMAMRIFGEKYMFYYLKKKGIIHSGDPIDNLQFGQLFDLFKNICTSQKTINILDLIRIFTPIEIHVNGFAYEPLIDYSIVRLRKLFRDLNNLLGKTLKPQ